MKYVQNFIVNFTNIFIVNFEHISLLVLVSIANFEQVLAGWEKHNENNLGLCIKDKKTQTQLKNTGFY